MEPLPGLQTWLYNNLPVGVAILDNDLTYRYTNAAYAATQGYAYGQLDGRPVSQGQPDWVEMITEMTVRAKVAQHAIEAYDVPLVYPRQPSLHRRWDVTVLPVGTDAAPEGYVIYLVDVTSRQQAEQLRASETRLRSILEVAIDPILVIDEDGIILSVNPATSRSFGYTQEELVGQPITTIMPAPYKEEHDLYMDRYEHTGIPHIIGTVRPVQGRRKNGQVFPLELSVAESRESGQRRIFVGIMRDISDRVRVQRELEDARARLEAILDTVPLPLFVIDREARVVLSNEAARRFYSGEVTEGRIFGMTRLHPDTHAPWPPEDWPLRRALSEGRAIHDVEQIIVFDDGREVPVLVQGAPVVVDGEVIAAVGVTQDLTQLKAADRAKDAFLALISHELKSPLSTIISWANLAVEDRDLQPEALQVILRSAHAQQRIISDLLDLSRAMYGKLGLEMEPLDAWDVTLRTVEGMRAAVGERKIALVIEPPAAPLPICADPVRLAQIISNLMTNAMKFTPAGGTITVSGAREGHWARLRVSDTGQGIPPDQLPRLFERFQQLGRERISGGLGLGLALIKTLVDLHGGTVTAASPGVGQGSTFTVCLPLRDAD